jgi:hypothetical protein
MIRRVAEGFLEEEGDNRLASSSFHARGLVSCLGVINFRLEHVIITSFILAGLMREQK